MDLLTTIRALAPERYQDRWGSQQHREFDSSRRQTWAILRLKTPGDSDLTSGRQVTYQYDAFISYRRVDGSAAAAALRHKLLDYRLPRGFQQRPLRIYLDRIYEHATEDFFVNTIQPALAASRTLIVVQTPSAAANRDDGQENWVAREVRVFRSLPQRDRVWVALAIGEFTDPLPAGIERELPNVERVDIRPLAGAWRRLSEHELLKFIGPLHGIPAHQMPDLRRESERRARSRVMIWGTVGLLLIATLATLSVLALANAARARQQQRLAEQRLAESISRELASKSDDFLTIDYPAALATVASALRTAQTPEALNAAYRMLSANAFLRRVVVTSDQPLLKLVVDNGTVLAGGREGTLLNWNLAAPDTRPTERHPAAGDMSALAAVGDGRILFASGTLVRSTAVAPGAQDIAFDVEGGVRSLAARGQLLAIGYIDGSVQVWNWRQRAPLTPRWKAAERQVVDLRFAPDDNTLATIGGRDVTVWDWRSGRRQYHLQVGDRVSLWSIAFHPNKPVLALGDDHGVVHLWPFQVLPAATRKYSALADPGRVTRAVSFAVSGTLVAGFEDGAIVALDEELRPLIGPVVVGHRSAVQDVAFIDRTQFLSAGYDGRLILWDLNARARLAPGVPHLVSRALEWGTAPDGSVCILVDEGDEYALYAVSPDGTRIGERIDSFTKETAAVDLSRGRDTHAALGGDGSLHGRIDGREYRLPAGTISLAREESVLAIDSVARGVAVANQRFAGAWSLTGTPAIAPRELQLNGRPVKVALHPNGRRILVLDQGGAIHVVPHSPTAPIIVINKGGVAISDTKALFTWNPAAGEATGELGIEGRIQGGKLVISLAVAADQGSSAARARALGFDLIVPTA